MTTCATKGNRAGAALRRGGTVPQTEKTAARKQRKTLDGGMDDELSRLFDGGMKKKDLCTHFGRTPGAIESRLERLGKL